MAKRYPSQTLDKFILRLPHGMRDRIAKVARKNKRSMTAEIISRLEISLEVGDDWGIPDFVTPQLINQIHESHAMLKDLSKRIDALPDQPMKGAKTIKC